MIDVTIRMIGSRDGREIDEVHRVEFDDLTGLALWLTVNGEKVRLVAAEGVLEDFTPEAT